ncbi:MAG: hypothetical protein AAGL98_01500, partial [Planctomycetota bacterium]
MSAFPSTIPVKTDADGRIDVDMDCRACGYNVRMQVAAEGCPECGTAIDVSVRAEADGLMRADAAWLARVRRGTRWLHAGVWVSLAGVLPGLIVAAAALWLLTTKEPGRPETWYARGTRLSARWAGVLAAVASVVTAGLFVARLDAWTWSFNSLVGQDWGAFDLWFSTATAAMAVALLEAWRHLFALAARADGPTVAQRCRRAWKRYLIAVGLIVSVALVTNLAEPMDWRLPSPWFEWTAAMIFGVIAAVLLWVVGNGQLDEGISCCIGELSFASEAPTRQAAGGSAP